jgi:hypothetical protein
LKCRIWGWRLAVALIAAQVLGNLVNLFSGHSLEGGFGLVIASALLLYILSEDVSRFFTLPDHPLSNAKNYTA